MHPISAAVHSAHIVSPGRNATGVRSGQPSDCPEGHDGSASVYLADRKTTVYRLNDGCPVSNRVRTLRQTRPIVVRTLCTRRKPTRLHVAMNDTCRTVAGESFFFDHVPHARFGSVIVGPRGGCLITNRNRKLPRSRPYYF